MWTAAAAGSLKSILPVVGLAVSTAWQATESAAGGELVPQWVDVGVSVMAVMMLGWLIRLIATGQIMPRAAVSDLLENHARHIVAEWTEAQRRQ